MRQPISLEDSLTLNGVKKDFDHWRATRVKRGRIPDSLRNKVKILLGRYPTTQISRALGVNPSLIASRLNENTDIRFVEVHPTTQPPLAVNQSLPFPINEKNDTCSLEIYRPSGGILKVTDFPILSLAKVITQFVGE